MQVVISFFLRRKSGVISRYIPWATASLSIINTIHYWRGDEWAGKWHSFVKNYSKLTLHTMGKIDGTTFTIYTIYIRTRYKYIESRTHRVEDIEELSRRVISISPVPPFPPVLTTVLCIFRLQPFRLYSC